MNAAQLKELVRNNRTVTVEVVRQLPMLEGILPADLDLSHFGVSMAGDSTYLSAGMRADIADACLMPVLPSMLDAQKYNEAIKPGLIYFVFRHDLHVPHNEVLASKNWQSNHPKVEDRKYGSAIEVGGYTGYDVIGFEPEARIDHLFATVRSNL